nr:MAG TPA: hypothetical protein [Caudoviricetes sp.]
MNLFLDFKKIKFFLREDNQEDSKILNRVFTKILVW